MSHHWAYCINSLTREQPSLASWTRSFPPIIIRSRDVGDQLALGKRNLIFLGCLIATGYPSVIHPLNSGKRLYALVQSNRATSQIFFYFLDWRGTRGRRNRNACSACRYWRRRRRRRRRRWRGDWDFRFGLDFRCTLHEFNIICREQPTSPLGRGTTPPPIV
jgi:hypothetical protein